MAAGFTFGGSIVLSIAADMAIGAASSAVGSAIEQTIVKGKVSLKETLNAAFSGGFGAGISKAVTTFAPKIISKILSPQITKIGNATAKNFSKVGSALKNIAQSGFSKNATNLVDETIDIAALSLLLLENPYSGGL